MFVSEKSWLNVKRTDELCIKELLKKNAFFFPLLETHRAHGKLKKIQGYRGVSLLKQAQQFPKLMIQSL